MPVKYAGDMAIHDVILKPGLVKLLNSILHVKWLIEAFGVIASFPGAKQQEMHCDGENLLPENGLDTILPASALTVAIPLVSVDRDNGRTAFYPTTHRDRTKLPDPVSFDQEPGDCLIWDIRVFHSGEPNRSDKARQILYLTCCRPFWTDDENFQPGANSKLLASRSALEELPRPDRKRFARAELVAG